MMVTTFEQGGYRCEFCGGACEDRYEIQLGRHSSRMFRCPSCETCQLDPMFSEARIQEFYETSYFSREHWQVRRSDLLAKDYTKLIQGNLPTTDGFSVLEIGAGYGYFANQFGKQFGITVDIVEPSRDCVEFVQSNWRNVRCLGADLSAAGESPKYDAIFLFHVAEHLQRLGPFLHKAARLLNPRGRIFVLTPNGSSATFNTYREGWIWACPNQHYEFLSTKMPVAWFARHGLRVVHSTDRVPHWIHFPSRWLSWLQVVIGRLKQVSLLRNRVGHWVLNQIRRVGVLLLSGNRYPYGLLPLERWLAFFRKAPQDELYLVLEKDCAKEPENVSHRGSVS